MNPFSAYGCGGRLRATSFLTILAVGFVVFLASHPAHGQTSPTVTPSEKPFSEFGRIETQMRQVRRPNCSTLVLRGTLRNPYDEAIAGGRLIVRLRTAGEDPREIERFEIELDADIEPGRSVPFSRELTIGCTTMFNDMSVVAFANRRGAVELPVPGREVEIAAAKIEEAHAFSGNMPMPNSMVTIPNFTK